MKLLTALLLSLLLVACVQTPTESTQVIDDRPRLAFEPIGLSADPAQYQIYIDGVSYGPMSDFLVDENALRIIAGRHMIEVKSAGQTIFSQDVFLGENSTRVIKVTAHD